MKRLKITIFSILFIIFFSLGRCYSGFIQPDQIIVSPDQMHSFTIKVYDRDYHFVVEDLNTHEKTTFLDENTPIFGAKWTLDSKSIFIAGHYARGKFLRMIHYDEKKWKIEDIYPPENNIDEYEVLNWEFHKDSVRLFFKFSLLDEKYHPTNAYKCSFDFNPSTGAISNYKKEMISFDSYGTLKSALASGEDK